MALVEFIDDQAPYLSANNLNNNFNYLKELYTYEDITTSNITTASNTQATASINVEKTGYTPIGILFVDTSTNDIDLMKYSIFGNTTYVRVKNIGSSSITYTIKIRVLYQKN